VTVTGVSAGYADSSIEFLAAFDEVWAVDFEFIAHDGEAPIPICLTAIELKTNRLVRQWLDEFGATPPYRTDARALFVAYYASAEIGCHLALGWPIPERVLDLFTEFRNLTNGLMGGDGKQVKAGLLDALAWFRLPSLDAAEKQVMRALIASGLELERHRERILDYCESDVIALRDLLPAMGREIDLPRALLRGRSMAAVRL